MSFLLKDVIHGTLADSVYNEVVSRRSNYYYYIGKVLPWSDPTNPDSPLDTQVYEDEVRNRIISAKKITSSDISYVVPRIDWTSGEVYDQYNPNYSATNAAYSGSTSLKGARFYVLTTDFNVYKCLFNNRNSPSTFQPTGTDPTTITTSDGYVWKFMYTIPLSFRTRFLTTDYMPVQTSVRNSFYSNGEIDTVSVDSAGSGYNGNSATAIEVSGVFKSNVGNVNAILVPVLDTAGTIQKVIIKNAGNNYSSANLILTGNGISKYYGLSNVFITNPGAGFLPEVIANTTATISTSGVQPSDNASVSLVFAENALVDVQIVSTGSGYTPAIASNTTLTISTSGDAQPSTNATATLNFARTAILTPVIYNGVIASVLIEDPGVGYDSNLQTRISIIGDGANASLLPYVNENGEVEDVVILNRGQGYTYADLQVIGDGTGANLSVNLSTGDLNSTQSTVELSAVSGGIHAFVVNNAGTGYTSANISVTGDGSNFAGNVVLSNSNTISYVTVNNPGSGYTFANVVITGNGSNANVSAIFSPVGGHGKNAVKELFADTLMFYSTINNDRIHNIDTTNDYRQYGIIKDIEQYGSQRAFANSLGTPCFLITLDTLTDSLGNTLSQDNVLELSTDSTRQFEVVDVVSSNSIALVTSLNNYALQETDVLYDPNTASSFTVLSVNASPTINKFSGDLLYIDNRTSVSYTDDQLVTLRTILKL